MNILHIIDSLSFGGAQIVLKNILEKNNSEESENKVFAFVLRKRKENIKINSKNFFFSKHKFIFSFFPIFELKKEIEKRKIQILHCHLFRSQVFAFILKIFFFPKIKIIFHEHSHDFCYEIWHRIFSKIAKNKVNLFIAISKDIEKMLIKKIKVKKENIKLLRNFVKKEKFNPNKITKLQKAKIKERFSVKENDFIIGFVGRLSKVKGCRYLIKASKYLDFNFKIFIFGKGEENKNLKKISNEKIHFFKFQENMENIYLLFDILVIPSLNEGGPLTAIEAQMMGIPVIGSDTVGINEIIKNKENGLLFEKCNEKDIAKKIIKIHKDKNLTKKIIKNGFENIKNYSFKKFKNNLDKIYKILK